MHASKIHTATHRTAFSRLEVRLCQQDFRDLLTEISVCCVVASEVRVTGNATSGDGFKLREDKSSQGQSVGVTHGETDEYGIRVGMKPTKTAPTKSVSRQSALLVVVQPWHGQYRFVKTFQPRPTKRTASADQIIAVGQRERYKAFARN